jgi:zinc transporter ZupT
MSVKQALVYNLLSAVSCYVGFAIGVFAGNIDEVFASYTFGFAGGYLFIDCLN